jgi:hypothetical protein
MVFHYTIRGGQCLGKNSDIELDSSDITCYVGRDKHENEFLIKYGWPGDIWFHVDSLSSAHVYFRVTSEKAPIKGIPLDDLPEDSVYDMMQIVKNNSISGCKLASTRIVYTPHSNLKKTFEMESGTVTYHDTKLSRYKRCDKDKQRVKELETTKVDRGDVDFFAEMKANERRIIERKRREREATGGLFDPILEALQTEKSRAKREGDEQSGLEQGLAALEGLSYGGGAPSATHLHSHTADHNHNELDATENVNREDNPAWIDDAISRSLEPSLDMRFLRERGYTALQATYTLDTSAAEALEMSQQSKLVALKRLWLGTSTFIESSSLPVPVPEDANAETAAAMLEARQEEIEVLKAIFGEDDVTFPDDETLFDSVFPITSYEPPSRYGPAPPILQLEVYVDNGIAPLYPNEPPVFALVGGGLPVTLIKELTNRLRADVLERYQDMPGEPQIFNATSFLLEEVEKIIEEETADLEALRKKRLAEQKAEADKKRTEEAAGLKLERAEEARASAQALAFRNEAERRSYAMDVLAKVGGAPKVEETTKKSSVGEKYNTGVDDKKLISDLFGL